jgi:HEAT repeat protein
MKRSDIGSSNRNREDYQSGSSPSKVDMGRILREADRWRKERAEGRSKEQQDREQVQQKGKEEEKKTTYQDLSPELLLKLWAQKLVKNLHDVEVYRNYHDRNAAIDLIAKEADKSLAPEIVKQLTGCSSDFKLEILSVIKRWGNQSAVPELVEMLKDDHYGRAKSLDYKMYGAIAGVIGKLGGLSKVQEVLDNGSLDVRTWEYVAMKMVKTMLESPSGGSELVEKLSNDSDPLYTGSEAFEYKELTYGVLRMLGDMSIAKKLSEPFKTYNGFKLIGEICKISDDPKEIKGLADKSINLIREGGVYLECHDTMFEVIGGLGKRLVQLKATTEAEMLSKTLVAMFFNERVGKTYMPLPAWAIDPVPDHFNAVFTIEQHLIEPDPMMRLLYREAVDKKVCEAIAEKVVAYRKELVGSEDVEKFYGKLFEIFSHSDIEEKVRLKMIFSIVDRIGEVENEMPFMPELLKRLSPALLSKDWSSKAYEIYKLSKNSSAKDIGELFEELIEKHPNEQISPNVQKAIVRLASLIGTGLSLALKLAEKLSDEQVDSNLRQEIVGACRKLGRKLVNQGEDIKELTEKLCDRLSKEHDQGVRAKLISAIEEFGDESTVLKLARMLRLSREIYEDAQEEFQEEAPEEAQESAATLRGGDPLVRAQIVGENQQIKQIEQISSKNNIYNTSSDIKENEYEEIDDDVRQEMGKLAIRLLVRDAEKRSQELPPNKPATDVETGVMDSSQR